MCLKYNQITGGHIDEWFIRTVFVCFCARAFVCMCMWSRGMDNLEIYDNDSIKAILNVNKGQRVFFYIDPNENHHDTATVNVECKLWALQNKKFYFYPPHRYPYLRYVWVCVYTHTLNTCYATFYLHLLPV